MFRNLIIKYQEWRGRALDIWSAKSYPANVLSNLCSNGFRFEGVVCGSMEGFLQALKQKDPDKQRRICSMKGHKARKMSVSGWQTDQIVWWKGQPFDRQSRAYQHLLQRAYQAMFEQNERFRQALMATRGKTLCHSRGCRDPYRTILTEQEFCGILMQMRQQYDQRKRVGTFGRKRILVDMDCLWADASEVGHTPPLADAVRALRLLEQSFEVCLVAGVSCAESPSWAERAEWVCAYDGGVFRERLLLTTMPSLCRGDYFIGNRESAFCADTTGEWIGVGDALFPDWEHVLRYLSEQNGCAANEKNK